MDTEQCLTHSERNQPLGDGTEGWKSSSSSSLSSAPTDMNSSGGFDCNICLDTVQDPVVTTCGHLFCWPCIYKWIHQQSVSSETPLGHQPNCPVCKSEISEKTLIPLYGRGQSLTGSDKKAANLGLVDIPDRPRRLPCGVHTLIATATTSSQYLTQHDAHHYHDYPYYGDYGSTSAQGISLAGSTTFYPIINMFGEMIYTRLFGNSGPFYTYPISYGMASVGSARARRHTLNVHQSLSRLSFFLFCCLVLCLLLF